MQCYLWYFCLFFLCSYLLASCHQKHDRPAVSRYGSDTENAQNEPLQEQILRVRKIPFNAQSDIYDVLLCDLKDCTSLFDSVDTDETANTDNSAQEEASPLLKGKGGRSTGSIVRQYPRKPVTDIKTAPPPRRAGKISDPFDDFAPETAVADHSPFKINRTRVYDESFEQLLHNTYVPKVAERDVITVGDIETLTGLTGEALLFKSRQQQLKKASESIDLSIQSTQYAIDKLEAKKRGSFTQEDARQLKTLEKLRTTLSAQGRELENNLKTLGENTAFILAFRTARAGQFEQVRTARDDSGNYLYPMALREEATAQLNSERHPAPLSADLERAIAAYPVTLMMRKVSDQGFVAFFLGRPSKRLQLKAKSDLLGNIPVNQIFSHKVKGHGDRLRLQRAMFNEFSFQSRALLLGDGLPNSFARGYERQVVTQNGEQLTLIGIREKSAPPDGKTEWKTPEEVDALMQEKPGLYAVYQVHADPRAMKGSTEATLAQWQMLHLEGLQAPASPFTVLKNTDWEAEGGYRASQQVLSDEATLRMSHLDHAEARIQDYAEFLIRKEIVNSNVALTGKDLYSSEVDDFLGGKANIQRLVAKRIETAGAIAPDIDLLSVGTRTTDNRDNTIEVSGATGRTTRTTRNLLKVTGREAEKITVQKGIHHGSEDLNLEFPQDLKEDYPIGIVSTTGEAVKIPRAPDPLPHKYLFNYMLNHPEVNNIINPAYIVKNPHEFPTDLNKWPKEQIRGMKAYENWINDGLQTQPEKRAFYEKAKTEFDAFKENFPVTFHLLPKKQRLSGENFHRQHSPFIFLANRLISLPDFAFYC